MRPRQMPRNFRAAVSRLYLSTARFNEAAADAAEFWPSREAAWMLASRRPLRALHR